ncbi:protein of unknown function [Candidatus Nitrosotalea okcheonensis]|uniref:Uncharacterized protein n=1 Tax=Candidatus Nitrosotalea okcheonensis TaxID=1903276 RepID=A0A2H1FCS4_9ARCH|nr:protein of unknown function [Candidatus Nitrosotalea okcheonensis]
MQHIQANMMVSGRKCTGNRYTSTLLTKGITDAKIANIQS